MEAMICDMETQHDTAEAAEVIERFLAGTGDFDRVIEWCDFAETKQQDAKGERYRKRCDTLSPLVNKPGTLDETAVAFPKLLADCSWGNGLWPLKNSFRGISTTKSVRKANVRWL
jgi:hypothetical protein